MICKVPKKCSLQNSHKWSVPVQSVIVGAVRPTRVKGSESRGFSIMNMKADSVSSFLRLVIQVWQEKLSVELLFRDAEAVSGVFVTDNLTAAVRVHGELEGKVFYEFPEERSLAIASAVEGEVREVVDESLFAIIESFAEALSVDGALALARAGFASEVATRVLLAKRASVTITRPQIWAHFDSELGSMGVRVSLAEATS